MSKAVTFLCPNCRSKIKTGEPIGTGINVRACGECDHTYYVQALDETHCRMSMAASQTRIWREQGETINPNFKAKTTFSYSGGGRTAGKAYKAAKDFYTKFTKQNPDVVEDAEFEEVTEGERWEPIFYGYNPDFFKEAEAEEADTQEEDTGNKGFWIGFDFGTGESSAGHFTKRDPFMPEGGPWEPTQKFEENDGQGLKDVFFGKPSWRDQILRGEWIAAEPNRKSPEEIKEMFDKLRGAADRLKEATENLVHGKKKFAEDLQERIKNYHRTKPPQHITDSKEFYESLKAGVEEELKKQGHWREPEKKHRKSRKKKS